MLNYFAEQVHKPDTIGLILISPVDYRLQIIVSDENLNMARVKSKLRPLYDA